MKKLLSLIVFLILTGTYYSQSIKVDLKNKKLLNNECLIVEESNFTSLILIDSIKVGHLYYDGVTETSKLKGDTVKVSIEIILPYEFSHKSETILNIIYNEICNQYLIKLKNDEDFSNKLNINPFFHMSWANLFTKDENYKLIELSKDDYMELSRKCIKSSDMSRTASKLLIIGGGLVMVIPPGNFIVGGMAGVTALFAYLSSNEQLRKSSKYFKSASNDSE